MAFNLGSLGGGNSNKLKRDVDFIKAYNEKGAGKPKAAGATGGSGGFSLGQNGIKIIAAIVGVVLLYTIILGVYNAILSAKLASVNKDIDVNMAEYNAMQVKYAQLQSIQQYNNLVKDAKANIGTYPKITYAAYEDAASKCPPGVDIDQFSYENGVLTLTMRCSLDQEPSIPQFVDNLRGTEEAPSKFFDQIQYLGYETTHETNNQTAKYYQFTVDCNIKETLLAPEEPVEEGAEEAPAEAASEGGN